MDGHRLSRVLAGFDVHPDEALAALGTVARNVRQVDGPGRPAAEGDRAAVGDGTEFGGTAGLHLGEPEGAAVGVDVVLQRCDDQVLADDGGHVVGVHHRRQCARRLHVHHDFSGGGALSVPHGHGDAFSCRPRPGVLIGEQPVAPDLHPVLFIVGGGGHEDEVVAVGIRPVRQDVLADRLPCSTSRVVGSLRLNAGGLFSSGPTTFRVTLPPAERPRPSAAL